MKKFKTMMAMMLALVSKCVAFSSCSSDDDDNNGAGSSATAEQAVGTFMLVKQCLLLWQVRVIWTHWRMQLLSWKKLMIVM